MASRRRSGRGRRPPPPRRLLAARRQEDVLKPGIVRCREGLGPPSPRWSVVILSRGSRHELASRSHSGRDRHPPSSHRLLAARWQEDVLKPGVVRRREGLRLSSPRWSAVSLSRGLRHEMAGRGRRAWACGRCPPPTVPEGLRAAGSSKSRCWCPQLSGGPYACHRSRVMWPCCLRRQKLAQSRAGAPRPVLALPPTMPRRGVGRLPMGSAGRRSRWRGRQR
jgi:hypothetical protein